MAKALYRTSVVCIRGLHFSLLLFFCSTSTPSAAELNDKVYLSEEDFLDETPVITDATRLPQKLIDTPVSVTVIDRKMIEVSGALDIADLFRMVPGFQVGYANAGQPVVTPYGLSDRFPKRIEVRINGQSIYAEGSNTVNWELAGITVDDIERIEITRSPNAVSHGFNSFIASINIITLNPLQTDGTELKGTTGSVDRESLYLRHAGSVQDLNYILGANYNQEDGFPGLDDSVETYAFNFNSLYTSSNRDELRFEVYYADTTFGQGDIEEITTRSIDFYDSSFEHSRQQISWNHLTPGKNSLNVLAGHSYRNTDQGPIFLFGEQPLSSLLGVPPATINLLFGANDQIMSIKPKAISHRYDIETDYTIYNLNNIRAQFGASIRYETLSSKSIFNTTDNLSKVTHRYFGSIELRATDSLTINGAFMLQDSNRDDVSCSPRLSFNYHLSDLHALRGSVSYAERAPTLLDRKQLITVEFDNGAPFGIIAFTDGDNIQNEELTSFEAGYLGYFMARDLSLDLRIFRNELRHGIDSTRGMPPTGNIPDGIFTGNITQADINGFEAELKYNFENNGLIHLNYAYADVDATQQQGASLVNVSIDDSVPKHSLGILASRTLGGFDFSTAFYHLSDIHWLRFIETVDSYERLDFRVGKTIKQGDNELNLSLTLQNLLGDYDEFQVGQNFETRAYLQIGVSF